MYNFYDSDELAPDNSLECVLYSLASLFAELSNSYYREEGRRVRVRVEKKNFAFPELHIHYCFKVTL